MYNFSRFFLFQYLDLRFKSHLVRCLASAAYISRQTLSLGVTVFTPCVALKTIIGIPYWMSIVGISSIGICCTLMVSTVIRKRWVNKNTVYYSVIYFQGGLRAAIMIDVVQGIAMILCSIIVIIQGTLTARDGPASVITVPLEKGRLGFFK